MPHMRYVAVAEIIVQQVVFFLNMLVPVHSVNPRFFVVESSGYGSLGFTDRKD